MSAPGRAGPVRAVAHGEIRHGAGAYPAEGSGSFGGVIDALRFPMRYQHALRMVVLLGSGACARQMGTATVTSSDAPRASSATEAAALRLANEMCGREAACNGIGEGARYRTEEACLSDQSSRAPAQLARWWCGAAPQAGFEGCLKAIHAERCESQLTRPDQLVACRTDGACGP